MKDTSIENAQFQIDFGPAVQLADVIKWVGDRYSKEDLAGIFGIKLDDVCDDSEVLSETVSRYAFHEIVDALCPHKSEWKLLFDKDPDVYETVRDIICDYPEED